LFIGHEIHSKKEKKRKLLVASEVSSTLANNFPFLRRRGKSIITKTRGFRPNSSVKDSNDNITLSCTYIFTQESQEIPRSCCQKLELPIWKNRYDSLHSCKKSKTKNNSNNFQCDSAFSSPERHGHRQPCSYIHFQGTLKIPNKLRKVGMPAKLQPKRKDKKRKASHMRTYS